MKKKCKFEEYDVNEVIPNLWLGNCKAAYNHNFLKTFNIKYVVTIMDDFNHNNKLDGISYYIIPLKNKNTCDKDLIPLFDKVTTLIHNLLNSGIKVLVNCKRGHHRSASVVAAYLIRYIGIKYETSIKYINLLRPCALRKDTCMTKSLFDYYLYLTQTKNCNIKCFNEKNIFYCKCQ